MVILPTHDQLELESGLEDGSKPEEQEIQETAYQPQQYNLRKRKTKQKTSTVVEIKSSEAQRHQIRHHALYQQKPLGMKLLILIIALMTGALADPDTWIISLMVRMDTFHQELYHVNEQLTLSHRVCLLQYKRQQQRPSTTH